MEKIIHTDIFIAGAGPAGIAAAVAAAELGMKVCVVERNSFPGGRATASAVGTICGLYLRTYDNPVFAMQGFPKKFAERLMELNRRKPVKFSEGCWFLPFHPVDFEKVANSFLAHQNIKLLYNATVEGFESSQQLVSVIHCSSGNENLKIIPQAVIDCSGDGIICKLINHEIITDKEYQAGAIVFSVKKVSVADEFQLNFSLLKKIAQQIDEGKIQEFYNLLGIIPHSLAGNSVQLKMGLPWKISEENNDGIHEKATGLASEMFSYVHSNVTGFENSELEWIAKEAGIRTGIRANGKMFLKDEDVLTCKKSDDGICNGAWPVEYWKVGNKRVEMTFFAEHDYYSIPAGCLVSPERENFFFAGKIISAGEKAIASARVIGTCFGTGYAAGVLASFKVRQENVSDAISFIKKQMH
ncbi:FAD-dependent oxidoreductase [soil metagenome]